LKSLWDQAWTSSTSNCESVKSQTTVRSTECHGGYRIADDKAPVLVKVLDGGADITDLVANVVGAFAFFQDRIDRRVGAKAAMFMRLSWHG
jgi:hypothetical protein